MFRRTKIPVHGIACLRMECETDGQNIRGFAQRILSLSASATEPYHAGEQSKLNLPSEEKTEGAILLAEFYVNNSWRILLMRKFLLRLIFIFALQIPVALADASATVFLEDLTWMELRDQIKSGKTTIIIPIGGVEQNGPYMTLGKHNRRVKLLSEKIALALGNALIAPVISYVPEGNIDPPTGHMRFPGTITIPNKTFDQLLESAALSFKLHGFRDIVFLGDHGGYQADEKLVADMLNQKWATTDARAHALPEYYQITQNQYVQALKKQGYIEAEIGAHAGLADTSLMLALDPSLVRVNLLHTASQKPTVAEGVYGDPTRASENLGEAGVDLIVNGTVAAIQKATQRH